MKILLDKNEYKRVRCGQKIWIAGSILWAIDALLFIKPLGLDAALAALGTAAFCWIPILSYPAFKKFHEHFVPKGDTPKYVLGLWDSDYGVVSLVGLSLVLFVVGCLLNLR